MQSQNKDISVAKTKDVSVTRRTVFVANIAFEVGHEQLKEVFERVGPVTKARIVADQKTGRPRGFGFVDFADESCVAAAVSQLHGFELNGRKLRVARGEGGRGGGRGGGKGRGRGGRGRGKGGRGARKSW